MSLYGAMFSGVSGLAAQSQAMGVISDNISNVNTVGYKGNVARFSTLVTDSFADSRYTPGGVRAQASQLITQQGLVQASTSATDLAISGNGFFVVSETTTPSQVGFTRAGAFSPDAQGNLRNTAGYYLLGLPADAQGNFPPAVGGANSLQPVNVSALTGFFAPTDEIDFSANLNDQQAVQPGAATYAAGDMAVRNATGTGGIQPDFERSLTLYDSKGGARTVTMAFLKSPNANEWSAEAYVEPATDVTTANGLLGSGTVSFNSDGTLNLGGSTFPTTLTPAWAPGLGLAAQTITLDYGADGTREGLGQVAGSSNLQSSTVNGSPFGTLTGVNVGDDGVVTAQFSNGLTRAISRLPLATFPNANGLDARTGNVYFQTEASGAFDLKDPGFNGAGSVEGGALESSTVDLASEFTNMITTQRAYSASSKIITTADEMLDELIRIKR